MTPQPRKGFQNLGFGGVLSSLSFAAERKGAVGDIKTAAPGEADCHGRGALSQWQGFFMSCGAIPGGEVWSPRPMGARSTVGRDDVGIVPYGALLLGRWSLFSLPPLHFSSFCGILGMFHLILKEFSPWKP